MRTFVRHAREVFEIEGTLLIGRSSRCEVTIDDELASREHCRIEVVGDAVFATDLDSRNGVMVNGKKIATRTELHHGDVVTVGDSQFVLLRQHDAPEEARGSHVRTRESDPVSPAEESSAYEAFLVAAREALDADDMLAAQANARELVSALRRSAGRADERLASLRAQSVGLALELADRTADVFWLENVIGLHLARRAPISVQDAERLSHIARRIGPPGPVLDDYLAASSHIDGFTERAEDLLCALLPGAGSDGALRG